MVIDALARLFNMPLGIEPGYFGHARRRTDPSPGNLRAAARLAAVRKKNKAIPMDEVETRQVRRAKERGAEKQRLSDLKAWMRNNEMNGASLTRVPADMEAFYGQ